MPHDGIEPTHPAYKAGPLPLRIKGRIIGAVSESRTRDLFITNEVRYLLRYNSKFGEPRRIRTSTKDFGDPRATVTLSEHCLVGYDVLEPSCTAFQTATLPYKLIPVILFTKHI